MIREAAIVNLVVFRYRAQKYFWRAQVMADHLPEHIEAFVKCALEARRHRRDILSKTTA
ncbi:hypothetical protein [Rhizobium rhizophilum]|uniref:hypothetical protein n=1 Tax=Rhizobium rhizophilum TaxID=1850373 RepID=UPI0014562DEB|nr:hypothetical protein [Rhizobium rhizophilum]